MAIEGLLGVAEAVERVSSSECVPTRIDRRLQLIDGSGLSVLR